MRFTKFPDVRKFEFCDWKTIAMMIRPMKIGSEPSSPPRTPCHQPRIAVADGHTVARDRARGLGGCDGAHAITSSDRPGTFDSAPAVMASTTLACVTSFVVELGHVLTEPQDRDPVRDLEDVVHVVRHEHDAEALLAEALDEVEHLAGLRDAERRGRLVEDDELGVPHDRLGDGDRLPLAAGQAGDRLADGADRRDRQVGERLGRPLLHVDLVEPAEPVELLTAQEHVLDDVQVVGEREVLVDDLDARAGPRPWDRGRETGEPSKTISPSSAGWIPAMHLMSVDLPAPLSPTRAMTSPAATRKSTWYSAWTAPKRFETPRSSRTGWLSVIGSDPCLGAEVRVLAGADVLLLQEAVLERHVDVLLRDGDAARAGPTGPGGCRRRTCR